MSRHSIPLASACPFCGTANEAVSNPFGDAGPDDGDFSLCFTCGEWAIFDSTATGGQRKPTVAEYQEIVNQPQTRRMREAWLAVTNSRSGARS